VPEKAIVYLVRTIHLPDLEQIAKDELRDLATVKTEQENTGRELGHVLREASAVIIDIDTDMDRTVIDEMEKCRIIVAASGGYDHVDLEAAARKRICVSYVPGYCVDEVADHTIAFLLLLTRKVLIFDKATRDGRWDDWQAAEPVNRLKGRTLGILGLGRIGTAVALRAKALGLNVIAHDPYIPIGRDVALGVRLVEFTTLIQDSHILSIHTPLTEETRNMIGSEEFEAMRTGVFIINTARGEIVDHDALVSALQSKKVAGAGIDVFEREPPAATDPLLRMDNVIVTPHTAFLSVESQHDRQTMAVDEVKRILTNQQPRSAVNLQHFQRP
jgi:D-3-phosphoglycerate dehydrogenase